MLVWFDKNGILKEQLDSYGNPARVDSQYFKIIAYFDGLDLSAYGAAFVRLQRPDLKASSYPILFMSKCLDFKYQNGISDTPSDYFTAGETYPAFVFDFSTVKDSEYGNIVTLLDTPGLWEATITLISAASTVQNVVGTITFNVDGYDGSEEETILDISTIAQNFAYVLSQKLDAADTNYARVCPNFKEKAESGQLLKAIYKPGAYVFDNVTLWLYKIIAVKDNDEEGYEDYVYCTEYEQHLVFDPQDICLTAGDPEFPLENPALDKVILKGNDVIFPYTKHENVIGLQQTIREKLPIVSESIPQTGQYVPQQVWIDIGGEREIVTLQFGKTGGSLSFGQQAASSELSFGRTPGQQTELTFGRNSNVNNNEN